MPRHLPSKAMRIAVSIAQVLLAVTFVGTGVWKLVTPIPQLAALMPWMGEVSPAFFYATAVLDLLGGLGLLLPAITRTRSALAVLAALGCAGLMGGAIVFHVSRGEAADAPFNGFLLALSLFVAWGRRS